MGFDSEDKKEDQKDVATYEEAMDVIGTGFFQHKLCLIGGIAIISSYLNVGVITFILPGAHCDLHMTYEGRGTLASASFVGIIFSCHIWGFLSDTLGRRYVLLRCLLFDGILYIITMLSSNFYVILFLRFLNGIASCGGVVSIYAYVGEFQTNKYRSKSLMITSLIASSSYIMLPLFAWLIVPAKWQFELYPGLIFRPWRLFYIVCGVPGMIAAFLLFLMPESPRFLLIKGKHEKVITILRKIYKENHKSDDFPIKCVTIEDQERARKLDDNVNKVFAVFKLIWNQTVPLLKKPHIGNFSLLCVALFFNFFCNNGMYVWLPEAIGRLEAYKNLTGKTDAAYCDVLECGRQKTHEYKTERLFNYSDDSVNSFYGSPMKILEKKGQEEPVCNDEISTFVFEIYIIVGGIVFILWIVISAIIRHCNKKYLAVFFTFGGLLSAISLELSNDLIFIPIKGSLIIIFCCGAFPILNSIVIDLFPTNIRAMAACLTLMASRLGTICTHEIAGALIESHCNILMWCYMVAFIVDLIVICLLPSSPPFPTSSSSTSLSRVKQQARYKGEI